MNDDACHMTAVDAVRAIIDGELTSAELVTACLERCAKREPVVKAWAHLDPDLAMAEARATDEALASGVEPGPLQGIPVGIKDIIDTADLPTENGSALFAGRRPAQDATTVALLRRAGAVIMGKTVTTEFAMSGAHGTTNPHHPAHTPGGSSSGSGAAVADFMASLALGSQTGGSVIRPASFCGIYGYKPTFGSISRARTFILARRLDHIGVYGRSLADLALIGDALMVWDPADLDMRDQPACGLIDAWMERVVKTPRLAFVKGPPWDYAEPHMPPLFEAYVDKLADAVTQVELAGVFESALDVQVTVMNANLYANLEEYVERDAGKLMAETVRRVEAGRGISADAYIRALELADSIAGALDHLFEHYDALITAAAPGEAPVGLESTGNPAFQRIWTLTGVPTVTLPKLTGPNGLPIGVQVIGRAGGDAKLFRIARWLDERP